MAAKTGPATAVLKAFIDREIEAALATLDIPSRAALHREQRRMAAGGFGNDPRCLEGAIPDAICARAQALESLEDIQDFERLHVDCRWLEWIDEELLALKDSIPRALKRRLTAEELTELRAAWDACMEDSAAA